MKKKHILCLFDYVARTGFGTVSRNIVAELKKNFGENLQLDIIAINYFGEAYKEDDNTFVLSGKNNDVKNDSYARHLFLKALQDGNYDGVFVNQDLGIVSPIIEIMDFVKSEKREQNKKSFKSIFYFPIDCPIVYELAKGIEFFDLIVTYTDFAKKQILKFKPELKTKVKVIPHGNNSKEFYELPKDEVKKFRDEYFKENANKFIITNVNRNQVRKDIPSTIFAFNEALLNWDSKLPEPFLYLHCHPKDPLGWDLRAILKQTELVEDVNYKLLPKEYEEQMVEIDILNKIYNASDVYLTTTLGEGWGLCVASNTKVLKSDGVVDIKDVKIGDQVMTNSGIFNKVLDTTCRKIDSYIKVKTKYGYEVEATHEHPYYSLVNGKEKYRKIEDLKKGDYLAIVKPNDKSKKLGLFIDLLDYVDSSEFIYDKIHIKHKFGYSPSNKKWSISTICKEYFTTKKVVENAIAFITDKKEKVSQMAVTLANNLIANGFDKPKPLTIKRHIELTDDLLWVFGWYLAEGSCEGGKRLEFSMGKDEVKDAYRIAEIIQNSFEIKDVKVRVYQNKCAVRVSSVALAVAFKNLFGNGAYNKRIPEKLFDTKLLIPLVDGYIKGDGHINLANDHISFSTISPSLAYQMQSILASNNILISVKKKKRADNHHSIYHCQIPSHHLRRYMDFVNMYGVLDRDNKRNHKPDFIETDTHFFVPITSIEEIKKEDEFYDLCVDNSHSFVANGIVCHNTFSESASCKIPIIAPYSTSFMEMSSYGKNAYMLKTLYPNCHNIDNIIREQVDIYEAADLLLQVAKEKNSKEQEEMIERNYQWVKKLEWKELCKTWTTYFKEIFGATPL